MKTKTKTIIASGIAVVALCLAGACFPQTSSAQTESAPAPGTVDNPTALPPGVYPSSPLAQVIRLTQSGVSEDVIMSYVNNSGSTFNLDPDKIIYLKDIGAPDAVVTAMIQRDQVLQAQMTTPANQPPPQPTPATEAVAPAPTAPVTVNYFYDTLAPYGSWVDVEGYGRCWRPTVVVYNSGWQPYSDHGHWVYTDAGWYWMSDYSWGWAPFHYGRWFHHARFGWCWTPDTVWGPSWVTWRYSDDYCGWAPLPPRCDYREGVGFFYNGAAVSIGFDFGLDVGVFTFVHTRDFCDPHPWRHRVESREVTQVFNHTTIINNFNYDSHNRTFINHGIEPRRITTVTRKDIRPVAIRESDTPVARGEQLGRDGRTLMVNRPHFADNPARSGQGGPQHFTQPTPVVGSPYQPRRNGNENRNSQPPGHNQATTSPPLVGSPYQSPRNGNANDNSQPLRNYHPKPNGPELGSPNQPSHNGNQNNNPQPPHNGQPVQTTPPPGQRQLPTVTPSAPARTQMTTPADRSPSPVNRYSPGTPVTPTAPNNNLNNSTDNRRYNSPKTQQIEKQSPRGNPGNLGGRAGAAATTPPSINPSGANRYSPPAQPSQRNYGAPVTATAPVVQQPAPAQPPQHNYVSPRNQTQIPPSESRPNYSQPRASGNQSTGSSAPSSPPAQSQKSGKDKNQDNQR